MRVRVGVGVGVRVRVRVRVRAALERAVHAIDLPHARGVITR